MARTAITTALHQAAARRWQARPTGQRRPTVTPGHRLAQSFPPAPIAPLIVPSIRRVPFLSISNDEINPRQWRASRLTLQLLDQGVISLSSPDDSSSPLDYLLSRYLERHAELYPAEMAVMFEVPVPDNSGDLPALRIDTFQGEDGLVNFGRLHRALRELHPDLFGALVQALRHQLSPYLPLFSAQDALLVADITRFHEDWLESVAEAYEEEFPEVNIENVSEDQLLAWHIQQGGLTPQAMAELLPKYLWQGDQALLSLLSSQEARAIPGVAKLQRLLQHLQSLDQQRLDDRLWTDNYYYFIHPGHCSVIVTSDPEKDTVNELYHELQLNFAFDPADALPLHYMEVRTADDHRQWTQYLADLTRVRKLTKAAFRAAQGD